MASEKRMGYASSKQFKERVKYFMQKIAISIFGEKAGGTDQPTLEEHTLRIAYAQKILAGSADTSEMATAVITDSSVHADVDTAKSPSDAILENSVNSMINHFAGVD